MNIHKYDIIIFKIVARELEVLTVDSPEENTEDNIDLTEREEHNEISGKENDEAEAQTEVFEKEVGAEDTVNVTHAILKSEAGEAVTREKSEAEQIADYKLKVGALEYEIAKLKEELSKKESL